MEPVSALGALCMAWAATAAALDEPPPPVPLPGERVWPTRVVELSWTHSIERVQGVETCAVPQPGAPSAALRPLRVCLVGSGAGMEPAPQARWRDGGYEWTPAEPVPRLPRAYSAFAADPTLCLDGRCAPLTVWMPQAAPATGGVVRLRACRVSCKGDGGIDGCHRMVMGAGHDGR